MKHLNRFWQANQLLVLRLLLAAAAVGGATTAVAQNNQYSALIQSNQPQFAARLETPDRPDARELLGKTPASTMEYRIISDRINNRRFFKLLADAIAVNTDAQKLAKNASFISRSRSALPVELQPNDHLAFHFDGNSKVTMHLNGEQVASFEAPDYYRMLLSTWIGQVPISSRFKREILGQETADADIRAFYDGANPSADRRAQVAAAIRQQNAPQAVAAKPAPVPVAKAEQPKPKVVAAPVAKPVAKPVPLPVSKPAPKPEPTVTAKAEPKVAAKAPAPEAKQTPQAKPQPKPQPKVEPKPEPQPAPAVAKAQPEPTLTEEQEAIRLLLRQDYLMRLNREINVHKHIPQRAFTRRAEGSVRLAITLDSNGTLLKIDIVEPSKHNMFNEQALEAVGNAQPFTPPPTGLEADPFEFETTLYYDLPL